MSNDSNTTDTTARPVVQFGQIDRDERERLNARRYPSPDWFAEVQRVNAEFMAEPAGAGEAQDNTL